MSAYLEKNPSHKRVGGVAQSEGPEFKPQYLKAKQNKTNKQIKKKGQNSLRRALDPTVIL
jgi:hypothetical protein